MSADAQSIEAVNVMVWDATGVLLFILWLLWPPVYVALFGRYYVQLSAEHAQQALWAHDELQQALDDLRAFLERHEPLQDVPEDEPSTVPPARQPRADDTQELCPISADSDQTGRHRLDRSLLAHAAG